MIFHLIVFAFAVGVDAGLRSLTAPAVVAWAAHWGWLNLHNSWLEFIASAPIRYFLTAVAIIELIADKLPSTPNRTQLTGMTTRFITGGISASALFIAAGQPFYIGFALGAAGGLAGGFAGYEIRRRLVKSLRISDFPVALIEDGIAIGAALLLVSRV